MALLNNFIRHSDRLVAFDANFKEADQTATTLPFYRDRLQLLWEDVDQAYQAYFEDCANEASDDAEIQRAHSAVEEKFRTVFETYVQLISRINDLIEATKIPRHTTLPSNHNIIDLVGGSANTSARPAVVPPVQSLHGESKLAEQPPPATSDLSLLEQVTAPSQLFSSSPVRGDRFLHSLAVPPCDVEPFKGDYASWPTFRDLFTAIYVNNARLSDVEKLFHLVTKTKGEANEIVSKVPLTNAGFQLAWKQLSSTYENKRVLVTAQLTNLFSLPILKSESVSALKELQRGINNCLETLTLHGVPVKNWDPIINFLCCQRLPETALTLWEQSLVNKTELPTWKSLNDFLTSRILTLEAITGTRQSAQCNVRNVMSGTIPKSSVSKTHHAKVDVSKNQAATTKSVEKFNCPLCPKQRHHVRGCAKFRAMSIQERWNSVKRLQLCSNCLSTAHMVDACTSTFNCATCHQRHHTWLHNYRMQRQNPNTSASDSSGTLPGPSSAQPSPHAAPFQPANQAPRNFHQQMKSSSSKVTTGHRCVLLGTANVLIHHLGSTFPVRALIDSGSEVTCVSRTVRKRLGLPTTMTKMSLMGVNSQVTAQASHLCSLTIGPKNDLTKKIECSAIVLPRISGNLPSVTIEHFNSHQLPNLPLADGEFYKSSPVDLLIGADLYPSIMCSGVQSNIFGSLLAQETTFGWILTGKIPATQGRSHAATVLCTTVRIEEQLRKFWEIEEVPRKRYLTPAEKYCEDLYKSSTTRTADGRYIVKLPFRPEFQLEEALGTSRNTVGAIFKRNEQTLMRKGELKQTYDQVLSEYLDLGHMVKVTQPRADELCYYMPHHPVFKPDSTTTAVRVVFNASNSTSNGRSLNDILHTGPALQADLTTMLLKWRMFKYVFSSDITKMYRQILVNASETRFQRILFRTSPTDEIADYELKTVTFGVNCAPFLAIRTLLQLAQDVKTTYPLAAKILRHHMYVDDVLAGYNDVHTALRARDELIAALQSAGFHLRKWTANDKTILLDLPSGHLLDQNFLEFEETSSSKALGVRWNAIRDEFYFVAHPIVWKDSFTKREVLSIIAKLFDPAGWLGPIVIVAKIIMQQIWLDGTDWDACLLPDTLARWEQFVANYGIVSEVKIPRWVGLNGRTIEIHGFCDASEKAYAGTIYIRTVIDGEVHCHLMMAKTKVAPVKTVSIPRLELCGALLLANMVKHVTSELDITQFELHCWTDSTIVLAWLQKPPCAWKTFVASRIAKIQDAVGINCWRHVTGSDNPADIASRGTTSADFVTNSLWWHGPSWLSADPTQWPQYDPTNLTTYEEQKPVKTFLTMHLPTVEEILSRFSSYARALRVLSYVFRFLNATKFLQFASSQDLTTEEIKTTRNRVIRLVQQSDFLLEYQQLQNNQPISTKSALVPLNPIMDDSGLIRVNGRLTNSASLSYAEKFPIILPYNSHLTRLLVNFLHSVSLHGGNRLVLRLLRQEFWVPKAQNLIKATINRCKTCVLFKQKQQVQLMASLPTDRSTLSRPFTVTGVDFAGPFDIKNYMGRACRITKGYVCVFVCFSTKAIHLEVTNSLTSECFLAAFARFIARRGCPRTMFSDNGTSFVGASSSLKKEFRQVLKTSVDQVQRQYTHFQLEWKFIPAGAPHMGGLWEAGVKSFKSHFRKMASSFKFTFEEMSTLLCRIEACLNSRPLSLLNASTPEVAALTPGHFLIGGPLLSPAEEVSDEQPLSIRNRWRKLKVLSQLIASRWKDEYLAELHKRTKWTSPTRNLEMVTLMEIEGDCQAVATLAPRNDAAAAARAAEGEVTSNAESSPPPRATPAAAAYRCKVCDRAHALRFCRKFRQMSICHRLRAVARYGYCVQCLAQSHTSAQCTSTHRCRRCNGDHHILLHSIDPPSAQAANGAPRAARGSSRPSTTTRPPRGLISRTARESMLPLATGSAPLLMPTVRCTLIVGRQRFTVRGLIDLCADCTKVTVGTLQPTGFLRARVNQRVKLVLTTTHEPTLRLPITAQVVSHFRLTTPTTEVPQPIRDRFRYLRLADDTFGIPGPVNLILAGDVYPQIALPGIVHQPGLPMAQETRLGFTVSGAF